MIGDRERAAGFYPWSGVHRDHRRCPLRLRSALLERIAGIGAAAGGRWDLADEHFHKALRQADELPFELEGTETRRFYAEMLLNRTAAGDRERARSLIEQAMRLPPHRHAPAEVLRTGS